MNRLTYRLRINDRNARHVYATLLVGRDRRHMLACGDLVLSMAEQADLVERIGAETYERRERAS